jgi:hypothetical protein
MTEAANAADRFQYPPGDFRWRLWLLIEQIGEVFAAAQRSGMCTPSLRDPRGQWALDHIDRDPFAAAVWNTDQILKPDHLPAPWPAMFLADAEWFCQEAERRVVNRNRSMRLRETPRYKEVHARICHLAALMFVRNCRFGDGRFRHKAIDYLESDDLDAAERYCRDVERVLAGEQLETGANK